MVEYPIVEATPEEHQAFLDFLNTVFGKQGPMKLWEFRNTLARLNARVYLMLDKEQVIGSVMVSDQSTAEYKPLTYISWVGIAEKYRRKGLGTRMLKSIIDTIPTAIVLSTERDNAVACRLYEKLGFVSYEMLGWVQTDTREGKKQYYRASDRC